MMTSQQQYRGDYIVVVHTVRPPMIALVTWAMVQCATRNCDERHRLDANISTRRAIRGLALLLSWSGRVMHRDAGRALAITGVIAVGLAFDQGVEFWGQTLTNVGIWAAFLYWLRQAPPHDQRALSICVFYATLGEIFLSLVWGLYEYRLANVPLFVPPGHALLFMLGRILAERAPGWIQWFVPLASAPFIFLLAWSGLGTLDGLLFALFLLCMLSGRAGRLYAVMFVLSLAMEIYGTRVGNWTWAAEAPWLGFTTINPPLAAGAFYCMLDMLVVATVARNRPAPELRLGPALATAQPK